MNEAVGARKTALLVDRRKRLRVHVHWAVSLAGTAGGQPVESTTRDVSSGGFYCLSQWPFAPGECVDCTIRVPAHDPKRRGDSLCLHCRVRVVRVEAKGLSGPFGIGCRIEDYRVVRASQ